MSTECAVVEVRHTLDGDELELFWGLYERAFGPLRTKAAARHVLTRAEFVSEMTDPRVEKHVARDADGSALGLTTLTSDLSTVPWISPEYFAARFPEHAARGAIYYLGFTVVDVAVRGGTVFSDMIRSCMTEAVAAGGVCGYDVCAYNDEVLRMDAMFTRTMAGHFPITHHRLDHQTYYAVVAS